MVCISCSFRSGGAASSSHGRLKSRVAVRCHSTGQEQAADARVGENTAPTLWCSSSFSNEREASQTLEANTEAQYNIESHRTRRWGSPLDPVDVSKRMNQTSLQLCLELVNTCTPGKRWSYATVLPEVRLSVCTVTQAEPRAEESIPDTFIPVCKPEEVPKGKGAIVAGMCPYCRM